KIDRVAGEDERRAIVAHLDEGFSDVVEALVPFSAREALLGRGDPERLLRSNRAELDRVLSERFFARAEAIKREASTRRMSAILDEAHRRAEGEAGAGAERRAALQAAQDALGAEQQRFVR